MQAPAPASFPSPDSRDQEDCAFCGRLHPRLFSALLTFALFIRFLRQLPPQGHTLANVVVHESSLNRDLRAGLLDSRKDLAFCKLNLTPHESKAARYLRNEICLGLL